MIVLDPGHGDVFDKWLDPGALGIDEKPPHEKDLVLALSKKIGKKLEKRGHTVFYTRTKDIPEKQKRWIWRTDFSKSKKAVMTQMVVRV